MLKVIDLSNHQRGMSLDTLKADAFIFKATEGTYFIDDTCDTFVQQAKKLNKPYGVYHFLDQNDVIKQADFFLTHIKGYLGEAILVLDYEEYGKQGAQKAKEFLDYVYKQTGVKPLIYMNESDANSDDWLDVVAGDYGLWVAKYSQHTPIVKQWPSYAMWQYTSTPVDTSYFYGDKLAWQQYAAPKKTITQQKDAYHTTGTRFEALRTLVIQADESFKKASGMYFSKSTVFDIEQICHTKTTTHACILYNHRKVFVTLHKDYVRKID
ncbi:GH25 family lysozyme [Vagococcus luciliae]|uniref:Lysozyme n=1 Tax=Vagococcus luciliae TaxID=2920380 RepID=A0ABY5P2M0_9ENTE|nr:GH25 family lysozyme [Vagococcus luciliae]UUV99891.1 hypothetical protein G314FT_20600 [Vagococcus luciliae]